MLGAGAVAAMTARGAIAAPSKAKPAARLDSPVLVMSVSIRVHPVFLGNYAGWPPVERGEFTDAKQPEPRGDLAKLITVVPSTQGGTIMKTWIMALAAVALAAPALARDDTGGPPTFGSIGAIKPTLQANPVAGLIHFGGQTIKLEDTELIKLASRLEVDVRHRGQGKTEISWICFTNESDEMRVWFSADDLSDGAVDGVELAYLPKIKASEDCPEAPSGGKISLPNAVALHATESDLRKRLGDPSYTHDGLFGFFYGKKTTGENVSYRTSELWAAVDKGQVGALGLHQATQNF
jgi:hypothetical protein